jgi:hypothetical protein
MTFDRDLKWKRRGVFCLLLANLVACFGNARVGAWWIAAACFVWACSTSAMLAIITAHQITRNDLRRIEKAWQEWQP